MQGHHDRVSTTAGEGGRKSSKPIMEKRRRARINASLAELKSLLLEAIRKEGARHNKMEKADILEMAVKHLRQIQRQHFTGDSRGESSAATRYQLGFQACAQEVSKYLDSNSDEEVELKTKLLNHLANCITNDAFPAPQADSGGSYGQEGRTSGISQMVTSASSIATTTTTQEAFLSPSSSTPSSSSSVSLAPSAGNLLSSPFSRFLCPSTPSSSSLSVSGAATPSVIIPISPLPLGAISPSPLLTGMVTPEKMKTLQQSGLQPVTASALQPQTATSSGDIPVPASLNLSSVRISDTGMFKTVPLSQSSAALQPQADPAMAQAVRALSFFPTPSAPVIAAENHTKSEVNNNNINNNNNSALLSHLASLQEKALPKTSSLALVDTTSNGSITVKQQQNSRLAAENNNNILNDNTINNNNNNNPLGFPAIINLGSTTIDTKGPQHVLPLQQPNLMQLLKQQQNISMIPAQISREEQQLQQHTLLINSNNAIVEANTGLITNMNQLQLVPTKTASGEIAFVLSTTNLNPSPLAINTKHPADFAIPLQLPQTASIISQQPTSQPTPSPESAPAPTPTPTEHNSSHAEELNVQHQQRTELRPFAHIRMSSPGQASPQDLPASAVPSAFPVSGKESEQVAPLNLSSPSAKAAASKCEQAAARPSSPPVLELRNSTVSTGIGSDAFASPTSSPFLLPRYPNCTSSSNTKEELSSSRSHASASSSYSDVERSSGTSVTSRTATICRADTSWVTSSVPGHTDSKADHPTNQMPSPAFVKSRCLAENAGASGWGEDPPSYVSGSHWGGHYFSRRHSLSPPLAHSNGGRRDASRASADVGQPSRHNKNRNLFRPW